MTRPLKTSILVAAAAAFLLALAPSPAMAKSGAKAPACWKVLLNDWWDGRIDGKYELRCYRQALSRLSPDLEGYSSARDDISLALQRRLAQLRGEGAGSGKDGDGTGSGGSGDDGVSDSRIVSSNKDRGGGKNGPVGDLVGSLGPDDATSVPIPLIVLAGIALLLMAAGAATFIAKRAQARRVSTPVRPEPPSPPAAPPS